MSISAADQNTRSSLERITRAREVAASGEARRIRIRAQTSLSEIAGACGVDTGTVWKWETGKRQPRGELAVRYLAVIEMLARAA